MQCLFLPPIRTSISDVTLFDNRFRKVHLTKYRVQQTKGTPPRILPGEIVTVVGHDGCRKRI